MLVTANSNVKYAVAREGLKHFIDLKCPRRITELLTTSRNLDWIAENEKKSKMRALVCWKTGQLHSFDDSKGPFVSFCAFFKHLEYLMVLKIPAINTYVWAEISAIFGKPMTCLYPRLCN